MPPCLRCSENILWRKQHLSQDLELSGSQLRPFKLYYLTSVQFSRSVVSNSLQPWTIAHQVSLSITNSRSPPKPMSIELVMPSNDLTLCRPLLLLPSIFPNIRVFSSESALHQVAKLLEFQLQHQSFQWTHRTDFLYNGLVGTPCSPRDSQESSPTPQFKSINSLALSFLHSPTLTSIHDHRKNLPLTRRTSFRKVMSLLLNMLSSLVITFLLRSKRLLISWLQSRSAMILQSKKNKVWHCFHCFPIYFPWSDGTGCHDLRFLNVEL